MNTSTDDPFRADVDEVLARYGLDDPGHAILASDLSDAFDEAVRDAAAEVERLRAAAGERDALREALQGMVDEFQHMARPGRAYISVDNALHAAGILDKANVALAAVPAPQPQADDRLLAVAERAARAMQEECYITIPSEDGILRDAIHALDPAVVSRRVVNAEDARDLSREAMNEMSADRGRYIPPAPDESDELWAGV